VQQAANGAGFSIQEPSARENRQNTFDANATAPAILEAMNSIASNGYPTTATSLTANAARSEFE